jgi:predicted DCC family thiol-disulfide oxidoreductase YuxK
MATTVVFYDGVCGLCNRFVRFLIRRDRHRRLVFAPLQGTLARTLLVPRGYDPSNLDTVYAVADWRSPAPQVLTRAPAVVHALRQLGGAWAVMARVASMVPTALANRLYDLVARKRYRTFGRLGVCPIPPPEWRDRFIESGTQNEQMSPRCSTTTS